MDDFSIAQENERIEALGREVRALLLPDEAREAAELLASGVALGVVDQLYPMEMEQLAAGLDRHLHALGESSHFADAMERAEQRLGQGVFDRMSSIEYKHMVEARLPFAEDSRLLLKVTNVTAHYYLRESLLSAGALCWLSEHWAELPDVQGFGKQPVLLLAKLRDFLAKSSAKIRA